MSKDPREIPAYTPTDAARYLRIPVGTLKRWLLGYNFKSRDGSTIFSEPLLNIANRNPNLLSFMNLIESHVLCVFRRKHGVSMLKVRKALSYLQTQYPSPHPLTEDWFRTDGIDIFLEKSRELEIISQDGQLAMKRMLENLLSRIDWNDNNIPVRLYPYSRDLGKPDPRLVVIDPWVSFGRPVIKGSGIPTSMIAERFKAGESVDVLAKDYDRKQKEIEEAIRYENSWIAA